MAEAARSIGWAFEQVPLNLGRTKPVSVVGVLESDPVIEEISVVSDAKGISQRGAARVRAFRVRSGLERHGLQAGDCLLVDAKPEATVNDLVVVEHAGAVSVHRVVALTEKGMVFDPWIPTRAGQLAPRIVGAFVGVLRKRVSASRTAAGVRDCMPSRASQRARLLRGKLGMVEATCAGTTNPRLRRALRNEAESLRRQLQNETNKK